MTSLMSDQWPLFYRALPRLQDGAAAHGPGSRELGTPVREVRQVLLPQTQSQAAREVRVRGSAAILVSPLPQQVHPKCEPPETFAAQSPRRPADVEELEEGAAPLIARSSLELGSRV
jgi:hypothetical protein